MGDDVIWGRKMTQFSGMNTMHAAEGGVEESETEAERTPVSKCGHTLLNIDCHAHAHTGLTP